MTSAQAKIAYGSDFLGEPALLPSEDREKYKLLFDSVRATIAPNDIFEEHWVEDVTHQIWEAFRWRRMSVELLISGKQMALERVLRHLIHGIDNGRPPTELMGMDASIRGDTPMCKSERMAKDYMRRDRDTVGEVNELLRNAGLAWSVIESEAAAMRSLELQRITQSLAKAESRRNMTLKAIERHRDGLGEQLRHAAEEFEAAALAKPQTPPAKPKLVA